MPVGGGNMRIETERNLVILSWMFTMVFFTFIYIFGLEGVRFGALNTTVFWLLHLFYWGGIALVTFIWLSYMKASLYIE